MTDKQLRSLRKTQLLKILHQQEVEIQRLTTEKQGNYPVLQAESVIPAPRYTAEPMPARESVVVDGTFALESIMQMIQDAAETSIDNIRSIELEKIASAAQIEDEARERAEEILKAAREKADGILIDARKDCTLLSNKKKQLVTELRNLCGSYMNKLAEMQAGFNKMLLAMDSDTQSGETGQGGEKI